MINLWNLFYSAGIYFTPATVLDYIREQKRKNFRDTWAEPTSHREFKILP